MTGPMLKVFDFESPGPVASAWLDDMTTEMPLIMGPAGSGKTTAACFKGARFLAAQMPVCADGIIRGRMTVIRDNYRRLYDTAIRSWHQFFPADFPGSTWSGGQDRPAHHNLTFQTRRGVLQMEVDFFAVGDLNIEEMLKGYETSIGWMNECDLLAERVPTFLFSRTGRFPSATLLPESLQRAIAEDRYALPRQVFGDLNPPDRDHWVYDWSVKNPREGVKLYRQPGGLTPEAENKKGKPRSAYVADAKVMDEYDKKRFVDGEFGYSRDGIPVYLKEFSERVHVSPVPLDPVKGLPLNMGFDAGGEPAAAIGQFMPNGQLRVLAEICSDPGTGANRFAENLVRLLSTRFRGIPLGACFGDPSAFYGADRVNGELAWMETVALAISHNIDPAPSNEPSIRTDSVKLLLSRRIDGQTEALLLDPSCERLISGFAANYKIAKSKEGKILNDGRPAKNQYSHVHDALQYLCLGVRGRAGVIEDSARAGRPGNVVPARFGGGGPRPERGFNVWDV